MYVCMYADIFFARISSFAVVASNFIYIVRMFAFLADNSHVLPLNLLHIPRRFFLYSKWVFASVRSIQMFFFLFLTNLLTVLLLLCRCTGSLQFALVLLYIFIFLRKQDTDIDTRLKQFQVDNS